MVKKVDKYKKIDVTTADGQKYVIKQKSLLFPKAVIPVYADIKIIQLKSGKKLKIDFFSEGRLLSSYKSLENVISYAYIY